MVSGLAFLRALVNSSEDFAALVTLTSHKRTDTEVSLTSIDGVALSS